MTEHNYNYFQVEGDDFKFLYICLRDTETKRELQSAGSILRCP